MAKVQYDENLINAVLGYMAKRPYEEVYQLIAAMQQTVIVVEDKRVKKVKQDTGLID